ncbi:hypothetical protein [Gordonia oryzae]|nr:hypothetical protein [Gordonia oryzae]
MMLPDVGFFNGHNIIHPVLVLTVWLMVGLGLCAIALRRQNDVGEDDELIDEVVGIDGSARSDSDGVGECIAAHDSVLHLSHGVGYVIEGSGYSSSGYSKAGDSISGTHADVGSA